ncbi:MAG: 30S ribosomal protein S7 [Bacteroidia bacterium]|nr:30S ribosomal protein S7 [Bacteroidia bacterium]
MRKQRAIKREITPDPKYNSELVARFVNTMMVDGKKSVSYRIFCNAIDIVERKLEQPGLEIFHRAVENVMPLVEVKSRRVGGATFQVPTEIRPDRRISVGIKWIINYSRKRGEKSMQDRLAAELIAASKGEGASVKKKDDTHRMAEANKAFSHFRF